MKTEIQINNQPTKQAITFPCLARSSDGIVVLFTDNHTGTIVHGQGYIHGKVGTTADDWNRIDHPCWTILPLGTKIILENT